MAGLADAKREACRYAAGMLVDSALIANPEDEWRIEVTDDRGLILFSLAVMMTMGPSVSH